MFGDPVMIAMPCFSFYPTAGRMVEKQLLALPWRYTIYCAQFMSKK